MGTRSFTLETLTEEEFDDFSGKHPDGNFQQTSADGRLRAEQGVQVEYLGARTAGWSPPRCWRRIAAGCPRSARSMTGRCAISTMPS